MVIGDMILANEVLNTSNSQIVLNSPNNIFPVLTTPAFVSFGVALIISGVDFKKEHKLVIEFSEVESEEEGTIIFSELIPENTNQIDNNSTLSANLSLRNIRVNKLGYHNVTLKVDNKEITKSIINIIKTD